jgi:hypothetical protein
MVDIETSQITQPDILEYNRIQADPLLAFVPPISHIEKLREQTDFVIVDKPREEAVSITTGEKINDQITVRRTITPHDCNPNSGNFKIQVDANGTYFEKHNEKNRTLAAKLKFRDGCLQSARVDLDGKWLKRTPKSKTCFSYNPWETDENIQMMEYWARAGEVQKEESELDAPKDNWEYMFNLGELLFGSLITHGNLVPQADFLRWAIKYGSNLFTPHTDRDEGIPTDIHLQIERYHGKKGKMAYSVLSSCQQKAIHRSLDVDYLDYCYIVRAGLIMWEEAKTPFFVTTNCRNNSPLEAMLMQSLRANENPGAWCLKFNYYKSILANRIFEELNPEDIIAAAKSKLKNGPPKKRITQR